MDLLVEVCGHYHLNPAYHTLELLSSEGQPVAFKPNAFLGSLDVACALIKERVVEERLVRKPAPKVPEVSQRARLLSVLAQTIQIYIYIFLFFTSSCC